MTKLIPATFIGGFMNGADVLLPQKFPKLEFFEPLFGEVLLDELCDWKKVHYRYVITTPGGVMIYEVIK